MGEIPSGLTISSTNNDSSDEKWSSRRVQVGDFTIDFNQKVAIAPDGEEKNLTANTIKLLFLLLDNQSTFVSADDIHDYIYGNQYKDDSSVRKQVTFLRKIFNDTAKDKKYIENKLGHGYRLVVPVEDLEQDLIAALDKWYKKKEYLITAIIIVISAISFVSWFFSQAQQSNYSFTYSVPKPLTHLKGKELYPSVSSDQKWLLFNFKPAGDGKRQIYLKDMENGDLIALLNSEYDYGVAKWSRDDKQVTYARFTEQDCEFMVADFDVIERSLSNHKVLHECKNSAWNSMSELWPNGQGLYYNVAESLNLPFKIYSHSFDKSEGWSVASPPPSGKGDYAFSVSNDGKQLAVLRNKNWSHSEIWLYDTKTWETKLIDTVKLVLFSVNWAPDGRSLVYKNESNQVVKYDLENSKRIILSQLSEPFLNPVLLPGEIERIIAVSGARFNSDIQRNYFDSDETQLLVESSYNDFKPATSEDGKQLAWISNRTGVYQIWYQLEDSIPKSLTNLGNNIEFSSLEFSPDGSMLGGTAGGRWFIYRIESSDVEWSSENEYFSHFHWRRDSQSAFLAKRESSGWRHMSLDLKSREVSAVETSPKGALIALESKTHDINYFTTLNEPGFLRVKDGEQKFFPTKTTIYATYNWTSTEKGLFFLDERKLMFLSTERDEFEIVADNLTGDALAMPSSGEWFITEIRTPGDTSIIEFQ